MYFRLLTNVEATFTKCKDSREYVTTPSRLLFDAKTARIENSDSNFNPMMSEKNTATSSVPAEYWSSKISNNCRLVLINALDALPHRLDPCIMIQLLSADGNGKFKVEIKDCDMMASLYKICGKHAKLMVHIKFFGFHWAETMAGLITHEMDMNEDARGSNTVICQDTEIPGTEALRDFWEYHTCSYMYADMTTFHPEIRQVKPMHAKCSVFLIVDDNWPLFKNAFRADFGRYILESGFQSNVKLRAFDGTLKCHKYFLSLHSVVIRKKFETRVNKFKHIVFCKTRTKASLLALLKYIYWRELPKDDAKMTFALLKMSCSYVICTLEQAAIKALVQMKNESFTEDLAKNIFLFVMDLEGAEPLRSKMAEVLMRDSTVLNQKFRPLYYEDRGALFFLLNIQEEVRQENITKLVLARSEL